MIDDMHNILIIEDDRDITRLLTLHLKDMGHQIRSIFDGQKGLIEALTGQYDLIILDVVLPNIEGFDICERLRASDIRTAILMLTSKSSVNDRVMGLEVGADDYLSKPFSIRELQARVTALLRRSELRPNHDSGPKKEIIKYQNLHIDISKRKTKLGRKAIRLTLKEFDLLVQFAKHPGRVYTRNELLDLVWGYNYQGYEHTVNSHINRLRGKLEPDPADPKYILTVHKLGYKFIDDE